ncbi:unnamed protein product [Pneumocystis jirovecii]|uniref:Mitochondrial thiamine pyrophosphate carrier 1 n=1 Tax=Pneumocystis jirovecii TaxID=42068 RepID=L0PA10_PNEJI|nr:unnamed protein product [Pneumocystis jirovecii]
MTSKNPNSFSVTFLAGAIAESTYQFFFSVQILVMYPLDVVKTRFQLSVGRSEYTGMMDCLISM